MTFKTTDEVPVGTDPITIYFNRDNIAERFARGSSKAGSTVISVFGLQMGGSILTYTDVCGDLDEKKKYEAEDIPELTRPEGELALKVLGLEKDQVEDVLKWAGIEAEAKHMPY